MGRMKKVGCSLLVGPKDSSALRYLLVCLALLFLIEGWLWAVAPPMAPPGRENKQTKPNEANKWSRKQRKVAPFELRKKGMSWWIC